MARPYLDRTPEGALYQIFSHVEAEDLARLSCASSKLRIGSENFAQLQVKQREWRLLDGATATERLASEIVYFDADAFRSYHALWRARVPARCATDPGAPFTAQPWLCMMLNFSIPTLASDIFVIEFYLCCTLGQPICTALDGQGLQSLVGSLFAIYSSG